MQAIASPPRYTQMRHVDGLDGLRGGAVLAVMAFHAGFVGAGWAGVQVFFVLSGYLITRILLSERDAPLSLYLKRFYWRRTLRIFPLYFAFLLIASLLVLQWGDPSALRQQWPYLLSYTFNFVRMAPDYIYPKYWGHFWSLAVEEQFYLVWPLAVYLTPRTRLVPVLSAILVGAAAVRLLMQLGLQDMSPEAIGYLVYNFTPCQLDAFAAGGLVAACSDFRTRAARHWLPATALVLIAGLVNGSTSPTGNAGWLTLGFPYSLPGPATVWGYTALNVWTATLISAVVEGSPALSPIFTWLPLRYVGRISYGLYVFHVPVLAVMRLQFDLPIGARTVEGFGALTVYLGVTVALSSLSFHGFERHFLAWKDRRFAPLHGVRACG